MNWYCLLNQLSTVQCTLRARSLILRWKLQPITKYITSSTVLQHCYPQRRRQDFSSGGAKQWPDKKVMGHTKIVKNANLRYYVQVFTGKPLRVFTSRQFAGCRSCFFLPNLPMLWSQMFNPLPTLAAMYEGLSNKVCPRVFRKCAPLNLNLGVWEWAWEDCTWQHFCAINKIST